MPRYRYMCHTCMTEFVAMHSFNEIQESCIYCESSEISKLLSRPIKVEHKSDIQTGQITKNISKQIRDFRRFEKESRSENYEPS